MLHETFYKIIIIFIINIILYKLIMYELMYKVLNLI